MSIQARPTAVLSLLTMAVFFSAALLGCEQFTSPSPFPATASPTSQPSNTPPVALSAGEQKDEMILSLEEDGYAHLFLFSPANSSFTRITSGQWSDITPWLSPDGKTVAFASNRGGHWDLYTLDLLNGQLSQLTNTTEYDSSPSWSPDLAWIAYETYKEGKRPIGAVGIIGPTRMNYSQAMSIVDLTAKYITEMLSL